eukprot:gnl/MRDRNA2_/MRDRNA2_61895_c0_seq1.p1 gnl/MRDRNA2_/MRDRNA2_61895_c0~~gnl/MRDRNA2_/MRDRNA2_61895_c0_seq1.p1  ORF type:complete len:472 (-),score=26.18 gnl/MRDRNA2_/MRDRNA2_61895_c0_seq1:519-1934(-)
MVHYGQLSCILGWIIRSCKAKMERMLDGAACQWLLGLVPWRLLLPASMQAAFSELWACKEQCDRCKKLGFDVQGMELTTLLQQWDKLKSAADGEYEAMQTRIRSFLGGAQASWRPHFKLYYVLPIVLHLAKLFVFLKFGVVSMLIFDMLVIAGFAAVRHPYAVNMTTCDGDDLETLPKIVQAALYCLFWERCIEPTYNAFMPRFDLLWLHSWLLTAYICWALCHQFYTLHHERSWAHRRPLEIMTALVTHQVMNVSFVYAYFTHYKPESPLYVLYTMYGMLLMLNGTKGKQVQPCFYTCHRIQHFKELYPFCHKYHHIGHPTTPMEAMDGGLMEVWAEHSGLLIGARFGYFGMPGGMCPGLIGYILRAVRVASVHGLWLGYLHTRKFHYECMEQTGQPKHYYFAERGDVNYRKEAEKMETHIPSLHYYHHIIPDMQFSYDSFARLDLVFGTAHKAAEGLLNDFKKGKVNLE